MIEDPLVVLLFLCSGSALLGSSYRVSRSMERDLLSVLSYQGLSQVYVSLFIMDVFVLVCYTAC